MGFIGGVHLLPATGEFAYDTIAYRGAVAGGAAAPLNTFSAPGGAKTDYSTAIDQLQAAHPECATVSLVCAWFADSLDASACRIYPSTTYIGGAFEQLSGASWIADAWRVSSLTQTSPGLIPIPVSGGGAAYGGTPSDQSVVRCLRDLKARGFKVVFYPFLLMTASGYPWRGRIAYSPDISSQASAAASAFLGTAAAGDFTPDSVNLTVAYSGSPIDFTYRRMILHYAWLCAMAGGVDLFLLGSELRGLETIRGPAWTQAGTLDGAGFATWDYPFVAGLQALAGDVRAIFDGQGLARNAAGSSNFVAYSADWSDWMGFQHPGANGQWPHLDALWADPNIDLVGIDNYLPLSDWTTGDGGLDVANWLAPAPSGAWPPAAASMSGLGLSGAPTIDSLAYLKANIEGGEKFNWYYNDSDNFGRGLDPAGADLQVSRPAGDRLAQARNAYGANQQSLANKQYRWWWGSAHQAVYDSGDGAGWAPHGPPSAWSAQSKSIAFVEYGFPAADKATNQPNVFFDAKSSESATPYWSLWSGAAGGGYLPSRDDTIALNALQAVYEYWNADGGNETSTVGVPLIQFAFSCVWSWDVRPFPVFPLLADQWANSANWPAGNWIGGRGPALAALTPSPPPAPGAYARFPTLATLGWSTHVAPRFATDVVERVSGRSSRRARYAFALYDIELTYEALRTQAGSGLADWGGVAAPASAACDLGAVTDAVTVTGDNGLALYDPGAELQAVASFFAAAHGRDLPFWLAPPGLSSVSGQALGVGDGSATVFPLTLSYASSSQPVAGVSRVEAVYLDGLALPPSAYAVSDGYLPALVFASAPGDGAAISADFDPLWLCRFSDDTQDFEEFMTMLFELRTVKLQTVRP